MRARLCRLVLPGVFAVLLGVSAPGADILLNTDFRDGKTHWQGGGTEPSNMGGKLLVQLDPKKWTVVYQHFATRSAVLRLQVTYTISADCTLAGNNHVDGQTVLFTSNDLNDACGLHDDFEQIRVSATQVGLAFTVSRGAITSLAYIYPTSAGSTSGPAPTSGRQTFDSTLERYWGGEFDNDELCLAFPPGEGTVSLLKVVLTKIGN